MLIAKISTPNSFGCSPLHFQFITLDQVKKSNFSTVSEKNQLQKDEKNLMIYSEFRILCMHGRFFPPSNIEASSNLNKEWIYHWRKTKSKWDRILFPKVRIFQSNFQFYAKLFILSKPNEFRTKTLWGIYIVSEVFLSFEK